MPPVTGIARVVQQGVSVAGTRLLLIGASFVSSIVVARALPVAERGQFGLLVAVGALGVQFGNFGLPVANTYLLARDPRLLPALLANTTRAFLAIMLLLAAVVAVGLATVPAWSSLRGTAGVMVWLVAATGLLQMLGQSILAGRFQFSISNLVDVVARLGAIAGMALLWWAGTVSAEWFALVASGFAVVAAIWGLRRGRVEPGLQGADAALCRDQLRIGARAYIACLASFVALRLPLYAVGARAGLAETAYFMQALVIADTMLVVPNALGTVLFPNLAAAPDSATRIRATLRLAAITVGLMLAGVAAALMLGPLILPFVYGKAYAASMPLLILMLPGVAALGTCSVMQNALSANGYPWAATASPLAGIAVTTAGLFLSDTVAGCARAYSLGGAAMLLVSSIAWWLHRHDLGDARTPLTPSHPNPTS